MVKKAQDYKKANQGEKKQKVTKMAKKMNSDLQKWQETIKNDQRLSNIALE